MDTTKWKSVLVPLDIYKGIKKDADENGRTISGQLRILYKRSKDLDNKNSNSSSSTSSISESDYRDIEIYRLKKEELMTFAAIGKKFNISRERARVIFDNISEKIETTDLKNQLTIGDGDLEKALAEKYKISKEKLESIILSLTTDNKKQGLDTKIGTLTLSKNLENFLKVNEIIELPVSDFVENIEKLRIEEYEKFSIFHLLDIIKALENCGYESHMSKIRAHAKKLAKALTQNSS